MNNANFALGNFTNLSAWPDGFAFIHLFLTPLWAVNAFDSTLHISEVASNASIAVPWGVVCADIIAALLGLAITISLAFCMGTDIEYLLSSPIGQPMAQILFNSFGQRGTLVVWAFVVIVQYMMGSSMVICTTYAPLT